MAQSFYLREQADRCRRLAHGTNDAVTRERLLNLAAEYDARAASQDGDEGPPARLGKYAGD
jgi:hypothetical protein